MKSGTELNVVCYNENSSSGDGGIGGVGWKTTHQAASSSSLLYFPLLVSGWMDIVRSLVSKIAFQNHIEHTHVKKRLKIAANDRDTIIKTFSTTFLTTSYTFLPHQRWHRIYGRKKQFFESKKSNKYGEVTKSAK